MPCFHPALLHALLFALRWALVLALPLLALLRSPSLALQQTVLLTPCCRTCSWGLRAICCLMPPLPRLGLVLGPGRSAERMLCQPGLPLRSVPASSNSPTLDLRSLSTVGPRVSMSRFGAYCASGAPRGMTARLTDAAGGGPVGFASAAVGSRQCPVRLIHVSFVMWMTRGAGQNPGELRPSRNISPCTRVPARATMHPYSHTHTCTYTCTHTYIYIYTYIYTFIYTCVYICVYLYTL